VVQQSLRTAGSVKQHRQQATQTAPQMPIKSCIDIESAFEEVSNLQNWRSHRPTDHNFFERSARLAVFYRL
jgi:hypothetical protein